MSDRPLDGRVAIVSGAVRGIGASTAVEAALRPVTVLVDTASAWCKDTVASGPDDRLGRPQEDLCSESTMPHLVVDSLEGGWMISESASTVRRHRIGWGPWTGDRSVGDAVEMDERPATCRRDG